jgi:glycogen debranching enzyme
MQHEVPIDDKYGILATSRGARMPGVLKDNDAFAVFDATGDIQAADGGGAGLYYDGTRHLSRLILRFDRERPLLLSSRTSVGNELFGADLTNPDVVESGAVVLPKDLVHVYRSRFLWNDTVHERVRFVNYGAERVTLPVVFGFNADFVDIFEVRGTHSTRRGEVLPPRVTQDTVEFTYDGRDGVTRRTILSWTPQPATLSASAAHYVVVLEAKGEALISLAVRCAGRQQAPEAIDYEAAYAALDARNGAAASGFCEVTSSSERFNEWLTRSLSDLCMMTSDTDHGPYPYAGVPWFSTPFGRDGLITALETLWVNPGLTRGVLRFLAATQADAIRPEQDAEPGKILHELRGGEMAALGEVPFARYYGSVDATPLFVFVAGEYYRRTADLPFIDTIWSSIERALDWMEHYGDRDGDGFLEYQRHTPEGLAQQGWKDSHDSVFHADGTAAEAPIALCEVQAYAYGALQAASMLAEARGDRERAAELSTRAVALAARFDEAFWSPAIGTYALALDGRKQPCEVRSSNAAHALLTGIATPERARAVARALMSEDMFSGWGIRTLGAQEARYNPMSYHNGSVWPHDNALAAAGLARYGLVDAAATIMAAQFDLSQFMELRRLPELFCGFRRRSGSGPTMYPVACAPQAWASGAVFLLLQSCLGINIDAVTGTVTTTHGRLPRFVDELTLRGVKLDETRSVDLRFERHAHDVGVAVLDRTGSVAVTVNK